MKERLNLADILVLMAVKALWWHNKDTGDLVVDEKGTPIAWSRA